MPELLCRKFVFAVISVCVGSGFQHGFHTGITNMPEQIFRDWFRKMRTKRLMGLSPSEREITMIWSTTIAIFSLGGMLGGALTGYFSDRCGRKKSIFWNNIIVLVSLFLMILSKVVSLIELFIFGRFLAGINAGLSAGICQIYLTEISPDNIRGAVASCYQVAIVIAIQVSQFAGLMFQDETYWCVTFVVALFPAIFQLATLHFCPESPRYLLMTKDDEKEARKSLIWLRGTRDVDDELESLKEEDNVVKPMHTTMLKRVVNNPSRKSALATCLVLNIGQQMCGVNAMIYFSTRIFRDVGMSLYDAYLMTIAATSLATITSVVSLFLVDKVGRRKLLLVSFFGMGITTIVLSYSLIARDANKITPMTYVTTAFSCIYLMVFSLGAGPIPWFITAEVFNFTARSVAVSVTVFGNWFANFLIGQTFLPLKDAIGYYIFIIFIILDCFFFCFSFNCPETSKLSAVKIIEAYNK